jgi:hypothetical protein
MTFNLKKRNTFGPRFGEIMGKHCHAALTAAARKNRIEYERCVTEIYQMLDSIELETDWNESEPTATVAAESKPAPKNTGSKKKATKGSGAARKSGGGSGSTDTRTKRDPSAGGSGVADAASGEHQSDIPGDA